MKKMKKLLKCFNIIVITLLLSGCETTDFDLQENPNFLNPNSANPEFLLNEVQYLFQDIMSDMITNTDDIMRYEAMTGNYGDIADVNVLNVEWERFYEAVNISKTIDRLAVSDSKLLFHNAINKLVTGYLTITMVDYVGDIPYAEAGNPKEFPNPKLDKSTDVYKMVLANIDQAILDINAATFEVKSDLFYGGNKANWIAFANTFKLRILIQAKLAGSDIGVSDIKGEINALLTKNIIDTESEDFVWKFSSVEEPESRHPYFRRAYVSGFSQYIGNQFMWMLKDSKTMRDPRIRYYLYRQSSIDPFSGPPYLACQGDPAVDYCYVGDQYWGLDHGESRTGRGDNLFRTAYGIYPGGGAFDEDQFVGAPGTSNLLGAGILPILTTSFVKFLTAEAALTIGTNGSPEVLLEEGVRASMSKVLNFGSVVSGATANGLDVDNYVAEVKANYSNPALSDDERLNIIMTEYYLAGFGNSIEAYNGYRRTGFPSTLQVPIDDDTPTFPNSFPYSRTAVERNLSLEQKSITVKVFWDKKTTSIK
jgi:hypothetical protein